MFAIEINDDTIEKIEQTEDLPVARILDVRVCLRLSQRWALVRGYTSHEGRYFDWTILPMYVIRENFEHDPIKIKTDFDQIVRINH